MALLMTGVLRSCFKIDEFTNKNTGEVYAASATAQVEVKEKVGDGERVTIHSFYLAKVEDAASIKSLIGREVVVSCQARIDRKSGSQRFYLDMEAGGIRPAATVLGGAGKAA